MTEVVDPININQSAVEIAVTSKVLQDLPDTPLARWIEYRAYQELLLLLSGAGELPASYTVFAPDARDLCGWLIGGKHLQRRFLDEIRHLIEQLQTASGGVIGNLCRLYC